MNSSRLKYRLALSLYSVKTESLHLLEPTTKSCLLMLGLDTILFVIILVGFGTAMYLIANLGAGPRDGLMTGLQKKTNAPIALVRTSIEIVVVLFGWTLGGVAGIGTLFYALGIGPAVALWLYFFSKKLK